ncbi:MAG: hypothetical protein ACLFXM_06685 [Acidimicrobiia bacterium]
MTAHASPGSSPGSRRAVPLRLVHDTEGDPFADEVATALRAFARAVDPDRPDFDLLVGQPTAPVIAVHRSGSPASGADSGGGAGGSGAAGIPAGSRRRHPSVRWSLAGAAAAAAVVAGAVLLHRVPAGTQDERIATAAAPTDAAFDPATAPVVWISDTDDPVDAARSYLEAAGVARAPGPAAVVPGTGAPSEAVPPAPVPGTPSPPGLPAAPEVAPPPSGAPELVLRDLADRVAVVEWSGGDASRRSTGTVILRRSSGADGAWSVVGSGSDAVELGDVRYDGEHLSFTVTRASHVDAPVAVGVWADDRPIGLGDEAGGAAAGVEDRVGAPDAAGATGVAIGRIVDLGAGPGTSRPITVALGRAETARVRVHHLVGGRPASVTEMVVPLTGAGAGAEPDEGGERGGRGDAADRRQGGAVGSDAPAGASAEAPTPTSSTPSAPEPDLSRLGDEVESLGERLPDLSGDGTVLEDGGTTPPSLTVPTLPPLELP